MGQNSVKLKMVASQDASKDRGNVSLEEENESRYYSKLPVFFLQLWLITGSAVVRGDL